MINEIYIRTEDDPYYVDGILDYANTVEKIMSKIRVILGTEPGEVLANDEFGVDIEYLVFKTKIDSSELEEKINDAFTVYLGDTGGINVETSVSFGHGTSGSDYAVIDIYLNGVKTLGYLVSKD